jgi:hypothetical protein
MKKAEVRIARLSSEKDDAADMSEEEIEPRLQTATPISSNCYWYPVCSITKSQYQKKRYCCRVLVLLQTTWLRRPASR